MPQGSHPARLPDLRPSQAAALLQRGAAVLLDVREPEEWAAGHAPGAEPLPLGQVTPAAVSQDRTIVAVCRSGKATDALAAAGVRVHNLTGGMKACTQAGLPLVTGDGEPGTVA